MPDEQDSELSVKSPPEIIRNPNIEFITYKRELAVRLATRRFSIGPLSIDVQDKD